MGALAKPVAPRMNRSHGGQAAREGPWLHSVSPNLYAVQTGSTIFRTKVSFS
jgi:hypothetical protein